MAGSKPRRGKLDKRRRVLRADSVIRLLDSNKNGFVDSKKENGNTKSIVPPPCPKNLDARAKKRWDFLVPELIALGRFEKLDDTALALYCESYSQWQEAGFMLNKHGAKKILKAPGGTSYRNPWLDMLKSAKKEMYVYMSLFGLSPADRARLGVDDKAAEPKKSTNEFAEF